MPEGRSSRADVLEARRAGSHGGGRALRRQEIVRAAALAIAEHGPGALTGQIAERAGVARPHVYRHFATRAELDRAVARYASDQLHAAVRSAMRTRGTPRELITDPLRAMTGWAEANPNLFRFLVRNTPGEQHPPAGGVFVYELTRVAERYLTMLGADPSPAPSAIVGVVGLLLATVTWWLEHPELDVEQLTEQLTTQAWLILDDMFRRAGVELDPAATLAAPPSRD